MGSGGSIGGRRGAQQHAEMSMGKAKSFQNKGSGKPNLDKVSVSDKVTNKPKMNGKRMK